MKFTMHVCLFISGEVEIDVDVTNKNEPTAWPHVTRNDMRISSFTVPGVDSIVPDGASSEEFRNGLSIGATEQLLANTLEITRKRIQEMNVSVATSQEVPAVKGVLQ